MIKLAVINPQDKIRLTYFVRIILSNEAHLWKEGLVSKLSNFFFFVTDDDDKKLER
jgi:hypothetical protein